MKTKLIDEAIWQLSSAIKLNNNFSDTPNNKGRCFIYNKGIDEIN